MASVEPDNGRKACPKCGYKNRHGVIFCEQCGTPVDTGLRESSTLSTRNITTEMAQRLRELNVQPPSEPQTDGAFRPGTFLFTPGMKLRLQIEGTAKPLELTPKHGASIIFGRSDDDTLPSPEIDLVPYGGYKLGISRRHASIMLTGKRLEVADLKSSNGTYLNGILLDPHEPHQLRDGDRLRLGNMIFSVSFRPQED